MNIIVLVKQVPDTTEIKIDKVTNTLIHTGVKNIINPDDLAGIEVALTLKETYGGSVTTVTMGPPHAENMITTLYARGVDNAYLLTDRKFAGSDTWATSKILSTFIKTLDYDLVIAGYQAIDGDTAQVGPEIAEFLHIPHVPYVKKIIEVKEKSIVVVSGYDLYDEKVEVNYPCLITVEKDSYVPRLPSFRRKESFLEYRIPMMTLKDLEDQDPEHYGLSGSPTQVEEIFPPNKSLESEMVEGNGKTLSKKIFEILKESRYV